MIQLHVVQIKNPPIYTCDLSLLLRVVQQAGHPPKGPLQLQCAGTPSTICKAISPTPDTLANSIFSPAMCLPQNPVPDGTQAAHVISVPSGDLATVRPRTYHRGTLQQEVTFVKESSQLTSSCELGRF